MKRPQAWILSLGLLLAVASVQSCSSDYSEIYPPGEPTIATDLDLQVMTWNSVAGATSYNLYIETEGSCPNIGSATPQIPTKSDPKVADITSPFSISVYEGCDKCYFASIAAENSIGESELSNVVGWHIHNACP